MTIAKESTTINHSRINTISSITLLILKRPNLQKMSIQPRREQYRHDLLSDSNNADRVLVADSPIAALELYRSRSIDVILLSHVVSEANELALLEELRNQSYAMYQQAIDEQMPYILNFCTSQAQHHRDFYGAIVDHDCERG